jgi:hypothetical protein
MHHGSRWRANSGVHLRQTPFRLIAMQPEQSARRRLSPGG